MKNNNNNNNINNNNIGILQKTESWLTLKLFTNELNFYC